MQINADKRGTKNIFFNEDVLPKWDVSPNTTAPKTGKRRSCYKIYLKSWSTSLEAYT